MHTESKQGAGLGHPGKDGSEVGHRLAAPTFTFHHINLVLKSILFLI